MVEAIARALRWRDILESSEHSTICEIVAAEDQRDLRRPTLLYIHGTMPDWRQNCSSQHQGPVSYLVSKHLPPSVGLIPAALNNRQPAVGLGLNLRRKGGRRGTRWRSCLGGEC